MKRLTALTLAALLILCGCAAEPETTEPAITVPPTAAPTEPAGIYDAASPVEEETGGAVRVYPLPLADTIGIAPMGSDLLLFSGTDTTKLTKFSGDALVASAAAELPCAITPSSPSVQVGKTYITYYDRPQNALVFLDDGLQEVQRIPMPAAICGEPALTADLQKAYYCTADALRCLDLETGLDRLVKEMYFSSQTPLALHCDDTVILCDIRDDEGNFSQLYISTDDGRLLYADSGELVLATQGASYFARHRDGAYTELLIGDAEQGPTLLTPHTYGSSAHALLEVGGAALVTENPADSSVQLDYYDLLSGKRTSAITLHGPESLRDFRIAGPQNLWFLGYDARYGGDVIYRWDLSKTAAADSRSCLSRRYTADDPDMEGLAACRDIADQLSWRYGVQILLWTDATTFEPWDYTLVPEYQIPVIRENLKQLEQFLALYPEGFLQKAAENTTSGRVQICLVRSILGKEDAVGAVEEAVGLQYWDDNKNTYLCLSVQQEQIARTACHELSHIIDSRVLTFCRAYDDWNSLNPKGFSYDYDYSSYLYREDHHLAQGQDRAFIDTYSMTYPKEDRARILEYAMESGNEAYFQSETMQNKLRKLCLGIREGFGLKNSTEVFCWEQYLKEPLSKK